MLFPILEITFLKYVTFFDFAKYLLKNVTLLRIMCYYLCSNLRDYPLNRNYFFNKEIKVSKVIKKARPIVEATLISLVLVTAALSVPAAIVFTAI